MAEETTSFTLVRTKLHRPPVTEDLVPRPLLQKRHDHDRRRLLALVSASAGYIKNTLKSSGLLPRKGICTRVTPAENQKDLFLKKGLPFLKTHFRAIGRKALYMLNIARIFPVLLLWSAVIYISFINVTVVCAQEISPPKAEPTVALSPEERTWLNAHPDIELGYCVSEPEIIINADGTYSGMVVDFLDALNKKLGTDIDLRIYAIPQLLENAQTKEVDGILNLHPEYADKMGLLKTRSFWPSYPAVFAHRGVSFKSPDDFSGKRVAISDEVFFSEKLIKQYGQQATIVRVKNSIEGLRSVEKGDVDFFLGLSFASYFITKYQLMGTVPGYVFLDSPEMFGIAVRSDWPQLVSILNKGIALFSKEEIHAIISKWSYLPSKKDTIELTPEERAWLKQDHTVRVRVTDQAPYCYNKDGKPVGIAVVFLNTVSKQTGIKFHFIIPSPPFSADLQGLIQHTGPDLFGSLTPTPEREKKILFTEPYVSSPKFIFTRDDAEFVASMENLAGKSVAVIKDYLVHKELAKNYPDINLVFCKNNKDALMAVSSGKAFAFIGSIFATPYMINEYGLKNIKAAAPSALQDAVVAMAMRNDWPELRDIFNKVIDSMTVAEKAAMINKWSSVRIEYGIRPADLIKWILVVAMIALVTVLFFVSWNKSLKKQVYLRTADMANINTSLEAEIDERKRAEQEILAHQERLKALASQLTIAEEKERRNIAADLHDHVGHSLALARMQLESIPETKSELEKNILVKDVSNILLAVLKDTRNLISDLSSPSMNELGLGAAISEWLEEHIGKRYPLQTEFIDTIDDRHRKILDENGRAVLFRNVRELITNVVKHAEATKVVVRLMEEADKIKIIVEDDGVGFNTDAESKKKGGGFGLFSIQERMRDLVGTLKIESEPGNGCKATLTVPLSINHDKETT